MVVLDTNHTQLDCIEPSFRETSSCVVVAVAVDASHVDVARLVTAERLLTRLC